MRVLVVDDNPDILEATSVLLRIHGHEPKTCHNGMDVWDCVKAFDPDVVVLDIGLPGLNGFEAAQQIRSRIPGKRPTIIAISGGFAREADKKLGAVAGFDHHLAKPVDPKVLLELIARATD